MPYTYPPIEEPRSPSEMEGLTTEQMIMLTAQRQERAARNDLIESLCRMGRFRETLGIVNDSNQRAWIKSLIKAEVTPDTSRCRCMHSIDTADYVRNPNAEPQLKPSKRYTKSFLFWSSRYGRTAVLHTCIKCGHVNALPTDIEIEPDIIPHTPPTEKSHASKNTR
jgi:hypothetical protein